MWKSWPEVAGLHGSPVLPQLKQISLYCFSLQQLSWQLESYPGWKTTENREQANKKVNKHFYHLTDRTFTHNFQLKHHVSYLPLCVAVDIYSASLWSPWQMLLLSISLYAVWPIIAALSNFDFIMVATKVVLDKNWVLLQMCSLVKAIVVESIWPGEKGCKLLPD